MPPSAKRSLRFFGPGGVHLAGLLETPAEEPAAYALFAHCFTCTKDLKSVNWISRELASRKIATLRFDFAGLGDSEGDFADTNFTTNIAEVVAAADMLRKHYQAPRILIGHSLGGAAVLAAAHQIPEAVAVVTLAAPSDTVHLRDVLRDKAPDIDADGAARVDVMGRHVTVSRQMLDDLGRHDLRETVAGLGRPLLIFHAPEDDVVSFEHAERLFAWAAPPKSLISLDGADHLLIASEATARYVARMLAAWVEQHLPPADEA